MTIRIRNWTDLLINPANDVIRCQDGLMKLFVMLKLVGAHSRPYGWAHQRSVRATKAGIVGWTSKARVVWRASIARVVWWASKAEITRRPLRPKSVGPHHWSPVHAPLRPLHSVLGVGPKPSPVGKPETHTGRLHREKPDSWNKEVRRKNAISPLY